jgi:CheY-like chemotaxis protein
MERDVIRHGHFQRWRRGEDRFQSGGMSYVLVVDDDADSREAVAGYLRKRNHRVVCARNGREAIRSLVDFPIPDAVVLDARMPEMDGVSFLEVIRCYLRWQSMPVFMLTAFAEGNHIERARQLGVQKIFLKANFDLSELLGYIEGCAPSLPIHSIEGPSDSSSPAASVLQ